MTCDICPGDTKVIESREVGNVVRRRRECVTCQTRFTTYEVSAEEVKGILKAPLSAQKSLEDVQAALASALEVIKEVYALDQFSLRLKSTSREAGV